MVLLDYYGLSYFYLEKGPAVDRGMLENITKPLRERESAGHGPGAVQRQPHPGT